MKCRIDNLSKRNLKIFAMVDGEINKYEIKTGKYITADLYVTRVMRIYHRKNIISVTPKFEDGIMIKETNTINALKVLDKFKKFKLFLLNKKNDNKPKLNKDRVDKNFFDKLMSDENSTDNDINTSIISAIDNDMNEVFEKIRNNVKQYVEEGFVKGEWSKEDEKFLRDNYPKKGRKFCANELNRNESSVQKKITKLKLKRKKSRKK